MMSAIANGGGRRAENASAARTAQMFGTRQRVSLLALTLFLASCVTPKDVQHHVIISVKDQKLALLEREKLVATYPVSTSKYGLGDWRGSYRTTLGEMEISQKVGDGMPTGTVFRDRRRTCGLVLPNAPGRDPIVSRILWLRGREAQNANAFGRDIYIRNTGR